MWTHGLHPWGSGSPSAVGTSRKVRGKREEAVVGCVLASLSGTPGEYFVGALAVGSRPPVSEYYYFVRGMGGLPECVCTLL